MLTKRAVMAMALAVLLVAASAALGADVTWKGAGAADAWSDGLNWNTGTPAGGGDIAIFGADGAGTASVDSDVTVGGLTDIRTAGPFQINLGTHRLSLTGALTDGRSVKATTLTVAGGTLQAGAAGAPVDLLVGCGDAADATGTLVLSGTALQAYLNTCKIGTQPGYWQVVTGEVDLQAGTLAGGLLKAGTLYVGEGGRSKGYLKLANSTGLTDLQVVNELHVGTNVGIGRIGDPNNDYKLPPNVNVTLGEWGTTRCNVVFGTSTIDWVRADGFLTASSGGACSAYLDKLQVNYYGMGWRPVGGDCSGGLDLRAMNSVQMDANAIDIIPAVGAGSNSGTGYVYLPAGTVAAGTVSVAPSATNSLAKGVLGLDGTTCSVANSLVVGPFGKIQTTVNGTSCGLDLADGTTVSMKGPVSILFNQAPADTGSIYWGLRWAGNHVAELGVLHKSGVLTWSLAGTAGGAVAIVFDSGYTYVALAESWPPVAVARNLTVEISPPTYATAVIDAAAVDGGSFDPNGGTIVSTTISCSLNETPGQPYVTLGSAGDYTVTLTVRNDADVAASADCTVTVKTVPDAVGGNLTWAGDPGLPWLEWFRGVNWSGGAPPVEPTTGIITFDSPGSVADDSVTNVLEQNRTIGGLKNTSVGGKHRTELNGKTLVVDGGVTLGSGLQAKPMTFANGTLQIGTLERPAALQIGGGPGASAGTLAVAGGTFQGYLGTCQIGSPAGTNVTVTGELDLRQATLANGTFRAGTLEVGNGGGTTGYVDFSADSGLTDFVVTNALTVGWSCGSGRIGVPTNAYQLPADVNITLGEWDATRCNVFFGTSTWNWVRADGNITASSGGTCKAYLDTLQVKYFGQGWGVVGTCTAGLDIRAMNSVQMDVTTIDIIPDVASNQSHGTGYVYLPAGTVVAGTVSVAPSATNSKATGELGLNGTVCSIANRLTVGLYGSVQTNVAGTSCGLDLADGATVSLSGPVTINFNQPPAEAGTYWGLRWAGNHVSEIGVLHSSGLLNWTVAGGIEGNVSVTFESGYTCVALAVSWPPVVVARNLAVEIMPPDYPTVVIELDTVDRGSYDPNGLAITSRTISCPDDLVTGDTFVTLGSTGVFIVTLTITNENGDSASADCTVTVSTVPDAVDGSLTWAGDPKTPWLEWFRGLNWSGGAPPLPITSGVLTFASTGSVADDSVTNLLDQDRTIGGLLNISTGGKHRTDLNGKALAIGGNVTLGLDLQAKPIAFANGTLQIGAAEAPATLVVGRGTNADSAGTMVLSGAVFQAYLATCSVGTQSGSNIGVTGELDLRNATLPGGVLKADTLEVGVNAGSSGCIDLAPGLADLVVTSQLLVGTSGGFGRIGDPATGYKLPPDANLTLGTWGTTRCNATFGTSTWNWKLADGNITASSGGTCTAYLGTLQVAYTPTGWEPGETKSGGLDLRAMNSVQMDVTAIDIIPDAVANANHGTGYVYLPAGTVTAGTVSVAPSATNTMANGVLGLNGTVCSVASSVIVGPMGSVQTHVGGASCGLDLAGSATLADQGIMNVVFDAECTGSGVYWGLRWAGDHVAELQALADAGKLTWDASALSAPVSILARGGFTYVGQTVYKVSISSFAVTDRTSGSALVTNEAVVTVAIDAVPAEGAAIAGYVVNETGVEPADGWQIPLATCTIQAESGSDVTLYAWAIDSDGNTASTTATIYYNSAAPVASNVAVTDNGDGTAAVTWTTDIPALGAASYGPVKMSGATPNVAAEAAIDTSHGVLLTGLNPAATNYKIVLVNTEVAAPALYWPSMWPIPCDVNRDCKVNILDLISIRNKLNQGVTGENIFADVNLPAPDGKINILDLIAVRNKLNTQCP